jgi:hypothetical protein
MRFVDWNSPAGQATDMRWLLTFAEAELDSISVADLRKWLSQAQRFIARRSPPAKTHNHPPTRSTFAWFANHPAVKSPDGDVLAVLTSAQRRLREALSALRSTGSWSLPVVKSSIRVVDGRAERVLSAPDVEDVFLAAVGDVILANWGRVRVCAADDCERQFLPEDPRQIYCSPEHADRARWKKFAASRVRDYAAEYERRQRKRVGAKVKIARRSGS